MQELSLTYYSNSLKGLSELLGGVSQLEDNNGVLMSVMLLYLHGVRPLLPALLPSTGDLPRLRVHHGPLDNPC